jgi:hypothetical protein
MREVFTPEQRMLLVELVRVLRQAFEDDYHQQVETKRRRPLLTVVSTHDRDAA